MNIRFFDNSGNKVVHVELTYNLLNCVMAIAECDQFVTDETF